MIYLEISRNDTMGNFGYAIDNERVTDIQSAVEYIKDDEGIWWSNAYVPWHTISEIRIIETENKSLLKAYFLIPR